MPKRKEHPEPPDEKTQRFLEQPLPPVSAFTTALQRVLTVTKKQSDQQLDDYRSRKKNQPD